MALTLCSIKMDISSNWTELTWKLKWFCTLCKFFSQAPTFLYTEPHLKHYSRPTIIMTTKANNIMSHVTSWLSGSFLPSARNCPNSFFLLFVHFSLLIQLCFGNKSIHIDCAFIKTTKCQSVYNTALSFWKTWGWILTQFCIIRGIKNSARLFEARKFL